MKKLFFFLFAILFLFSLLSFFSPKSFAASCSSLGGSCGSPTSSTCGTGTHSVAGATDCLGGMCCATNPPAPTQVCTVTYKFECVGTRARICVTTSNGANRWSDGYDCATWNGGGRECSPGGISDDPSSYCINPPPPTCGSKGGICSDAAHASLYGTEITGVTCNPSSLKCYNPAPVVTTCTSTQTKINGTCYKTCTGTCQLEVEHYCTTATETTRYGPYDPSGDPYCNASTFGGHPICCATDGTDTCSICIVQNCSVQKESGDDKAFAACVAATCPGCSGSGTPPGGGGGEPAHTKLTLTIGLDSIGHTGDRVNADWTPKPNAECANQDPKHPTKPVTVTLTGTNGTPATFTGNVVYDKTTGKFTTTTPIDLGQTATGTYKVQVVTDAHLVRTLDAAKAIAVEQNNVVDGSQYAQGLVTGDINMDNHLSILDYNVLMSCLNDPDINPSDHTACNGNADFVKRADLEDNGVVNKFDYNLFLREISKVPDGD